VPDEPFPVVLFAGFFAADWSCSRFSAFPFARELIAAMVAGTAAISARAIGVMKFIKSLDIGSQTCIKTIPGAIWGHYLKGPH